MTQVCNNYAVIKFRARFIVKEFSAYIPQKSSWEGLKKIEMKLSFFKGWRKIIIPFKFLVLMRKDLKSDIWAVV